MTVLTAVQDPPMTDRDRDELRRYGATPELLERIEAVTRVNRSARVDFLNGTVEALDAATLDGGFNVE